MFRNFYFFIIDIIHIHKSMKSSLTPLRDNSNIELNFNQYKEPDFKPTFGYVPVNTGSSLPRPSYTRQKPKNPVSYTLDNIGDKYAPSAPRYDQITPTNKWWEKVPPLGAPMQEEYTFYPPTEQYYDDDAKYLKETETEGGGKRRKTNKRRTTRKRKTCKRRTTRRRSKVHRSRK
jgi:hypothetical protein